MMNIKLHSSLEHLPVELIHRIFDHLDSETILCSIRYVSKQFYSITDSYDRHHLDFQSISKNKFHRICRLINWNNVYSITLSDNDQTPGQIELFLSNYSFNDSVRLRSITLINIEDSHIKTILEEYVARKCRLHCISITYEEYPSKSSTETNYLLSIIRQSTLRKLDLTMNYELLGRLNWPNECFIEHLKLFNIIDFNMYCNILRCSPYLKTIAIHGCIVNECDMELYRNTSEINFYEQLISLDLENSNLEMNALEFVLSLTPCLIRLRLKSSDADLLDGLRWEQFIQEKLPRLKQFDFSFHKRMNPSVDNMHLKSIMNLFETSFWKKINHGYVTIVQFHQLKCISLHSIPLIGSILRYYPTSGKTLYSNAPVTLSNDIKMKSIQELHLNLSELLTDNTLEKDEITNEPLFPKVYKLILITHGVLPILSLELLHNFVNFTCITELVLDFKSLENTLEELTSIKIFLEKFPNLRSLIIKNKCLNIISHRSIVLCRIRHLQMHIDTFDDARIILEQLLYLTSIVFHYQFSSKHIVSEIINYLTMEKRDFTYKSNKLSLKLWLGNIEINS